MTRFASDRSPSVGNQMYRWLSIWAAATSILLIFAGCASTGGDAGAGRVSIGSIAGLPQVQLPGATMAEARSVAMAAALTKGWDITAADANRLLLERPLAPNAPQAAALNSPLAPPRMQVETDIVERSDGAIVALRAFVLTNPGTQDARRLDYTKDYESQLLISLSSLSSAWLAARDKVKSEVPALAAAPDIDDAPVGSGDLGDVAETVDAADAAPPPAPSPDRAPASVPPQVTATAGATAATGAATTLSPGPAATAAGGTAVPASTMTSPAVGAVAPTIDAPASPTTAEAAATGPMRGTATPAPVAPLASESYPASNDMLVLNQSSRRGLWSYYAEDYARLRGCAIGDRGAMLLQEANGFEVLEVECSGGPNVLVKCRGGVCEPMR